MEQDKIDLTQALPATEASRRKGAPLWLQLILSLIVVVAAAIVFVLYFPGANDALSRLGITLPLAEQPATEQAAPAGARAPTQAAPAGAQTPGARQGQTTPGGNRGGFGGGRQASVVIVQTVSGATINNKLTAIGEGSAIRSVTVASASGGTLVSVDVKAGDKVAAGARIAILDSESQQNAYERAKLAATDADAALARAQSLAKANSISATQVEAAQLAADNARLALAASQIALDQRTITTPIAGTVGLIQAMPGNLINAQTVVTTIDDSSEILVNFWVPERYAAQIAPGMAVTAESVALAGLSFEGVVSAVDNRIDPASRTLQVQASLPNDDGRIRAGMSFSVGMTFAGESFPAVDPLSIQWSSDGAYVWKYADGKVQKAMVEIIQRNTDGVLVKGDVALGDQVVTQGVLQLSEGATVRLLDENGGDAAAPASQQGEAPQGGQRQGGQRQGGPAPSAG